MGELERIAQGVFTRSAAKLPNGLTVAVDAGGGAPVLGVQLWVSLASVDLPVAHLLEHLLLEVSAARWPEGPHRRVEALGGELNAATFPEAIALSLVLPKARLVEGLEVLATIAFAGRIDRAAVEHELGVLAREAALEAAGTGGGPAGGGPLRRAREELLGLLRPAPSERAGGAPDVDDVLALQAASFVASRAILVVAGDVGADTVARAARRAFASAPRSGRPRTSRSGAAPRRRSAPASGLHLVQGGGPARAGLAIGFGIGDTSPAVEAALAVLCRASTGDPRVAPTMSAAGVAHRFEPSLLLLGAPFVLSWQWLAPVDGLPEVVDEALAGLRRLCSAPADGAVLQAARDELGWALSRTGDTVQARAHRLATCVLGGAGPGAIAAGARALDEITPQQVRDVARQVLVPTARRVVVVAPAPRHEELRAALAPRLARSRPASGGRRRGGLALRDVAGGAAVLDPRSDTTLACVCLSIVGAGGEGLGAAAHAVAAALDPTGFGLAGDAEARAFEEAIRVRVTTAASALPRWLRVMGRLLDEPDEARAVAALETARARAAAATSDPEARALDLARAAHFGGHAWGAPANGEPAALEAMEPATLVEAFGRARAAGLVRLTASGGFDEAGLVDALGAMLEEWPDPGDRQVAPAVPPATRLGPHVVAEDAESAELHLVTSFLATPADGGDRAALLILDAALAWFGGRLVRALREERGLVYSLVTAERFGATAGTWALSTACAPTDASEVVTVLGATLRDVAAHGLSGAELSRCRAACLGAEAAELASTEARALSLASELEQGLLPGGRARLARELRKVGAGDVRRVAASLLRPEGAVLAVVGAAATASAPELGALLFGSAR